MWSALKFTMFMALKSIVTPFSMFAAPANGVWPPLRIAKADKFELFASFLTKVLTISATSEALVGLTIHVGERRASWNQYESIEALYVAVLGYDTLSRSTDDRAEHGRELLDTTAMTGDMVNTSSVISCEISRTHIEGMIKDWNPAVHR